jgi:mono/diheme cytochrome c family protein
MLNGSFFALPISIAISLIAGQSLAQDSDYGAQEYADRCAICHGADGTGDGPLAGRLTASPPDLTLLSERANGAFPFSEVYQAIDGRREILEHGMRDMPLWGRYFSDDAISEGMTTPYGNADAAREVVQGRILALVYYIQTIQQ